jgi:hypothetical protein
LLKLRLATLTRTGVACQGTGLNWLGNSAESFTVFLPTFAPQQHALKCMGRFLGKRVLLSDYLRFPAVVVSIEPLG